MKILAAAALATSLAPTPSAPVTQIIDKTAIVQVVCPWIDKAHGLHVRMGTAFRIGGYYLSVNHVMNPGECFINGNRATVVYSDPHADFAMISAPQGPFLPIDCGGFVKGRKYIAIGYARGLRTVTKVELVASGKTLNNGEAILAGLFTVIPGMSGGPVLDEETLKPVGTINLAEFEYGLSASVPLADTTLCKRAA